MKKPIVIFITILFLAVSCKEKPFVSLRESLLLNGNWHFALDSAGVGLTEKWYIKELSDSVKLPGSLDENFKGILNTNRKETMRLSRELTYAGMAWYQKEVNIPSNWNGKNIILIMERTKPTKVWVDTISAGNSDDILTAQNYDLTNLLKPGKHTLTILVNNGKGSVPDGVTGSHAWTEHTQSNWNGIIGKFSLEAINPTHIEAIQWKRRHL
jgi:beta-galactosidase/beta-glucuronidase